MWDVGILECFADQRLYFLPKSKNLSYKLSHLDLQCFAYSTFDVFCAHVRMSLMQSGNVVAWWLIPLTPDPEVGGSSPTRVKPCSVLDQGIFTPPKYW